MSNEELGRLGGDLAVMRSALGLHVPFGRGTLAVTAVLALAATVATVLSLFLSGDELQMALPAAVMVAGMIGLFVRSRRSFTLDSDVASQVAVSLTVYGVVWTAACGYLVVDIAGSSLSTSQIAALHAGSVGLLLGFALLLIGAAVRNRRRRFCIGLALSTLLAGMLLPLVDREFSMPLAHGAMALGYLASFAIQLSQLREAAATYAAD